MCSNICVPISAVFTHLLSLPSNWAWVPYLCPDFILEQILNGSLVHKPLPDFLVAVEIIKSARALEMRLDKWLVENPRNYDA